MELLIGKKLLLLEIGCELRKFFVLYFYAKLSRDENTAEIALKLILLQKTDIDW